MKQKTYFSFSNILLDHCKYTYLAVLMKRDYIPIIKDVIREVVTYS